MEGDEGREEGLPGEPLWSLLKVKNKGSNEVGEWSGEQGTEVLEKISEVLCLRACGLHAFKHLLSLLFVCVCALFVFLFV